MVAGAAIVWSTGGLIVRHVDADAWTIVFWRGLFASLTLLLYLGVRDGRNMLALFRGLGWGGVGVAICFGTASTSFVIALQHTSVATILFICPEIRSRLVVFAGANSFHPSATTTN